MKYLDSEDAASNIIAKIPTEKAHLRTAALRKAVIDCENVDILRLKGIALNHLESIGLEAGISLNKLINTEFRVSE